MKHNSLRKHKVAQDWIQQKVGQDWCQLVHKGILNFWNVSVCMHTHVVGVTVLHKTKLRWKLYLVHINLSYCIWIRVLSNFYKVLSLINMRFKFFSIHLSRSSLLNLMHGYTVQLELTTVVKGHLVWYSGTLFWGLLNWIARYGWKNQSW